MEADEKPEEKKPTLTLVSVTGDGPTLADIMELFRQLIGREPTEDEIEDARTQLDNPQNG